MAQQFARVVFALPKTDTVSFTARLTRFWGPGELPETSRVVTQVAFRRAMRLDNPAWDHTPKKAVVSRLLRTGAESLAFKELVSAGRTSEQMLADEEARANRAKAEAAAVEALAALRKVLGV